MIITCSVFGSKYAAEFTDLGVGVRPAGFGGGFSSVKGDVQTLWWNPAGLSSLSERPNVYLMHASFYSDLMKLDVGGVSKKFGDNYYAVGFFRNAAEDIPFTEEDGFYDFGPDRVPGTGDEGEGNGIWDPGEQIRPDAVYYETEGDYLFNLAFSRQIKEKISLGVTIKHLQNYIGNYSSFGFGLDCGVIYEYDSSLVLGASLRDAVGTHIRWSTGLWELKAPSLWWGGNYNIDLPAIRGSIMGILEMETRFEDYNGIIELGPLSFDPHVGVELNILKNIYLRGGLDRSDFSAGVGLEIAFFRVDYAFVSSKNLDNTHRVGITIEIPQLKSEDKPPAVPAAQKPNRSSQ